MGLRLINNINSIKAGRQLLQSNNTLSQSLEKLSSGLQINRGADSPAGLIISEQLRGQITGLKQAVENSQKAINIVGTAEGSLSEVNNLLLSIRQLAIDSANIGAADEEGLAANQAEVDSALNSIDRIADTTQYAGKKLLNGNAGFETSNVSTSIEKLSISRVKLGTQESADINYKITSAAEFASISVDLGASTLDTDSTIQVTGSEGSQQISFGAGSSLQDIVDAVDALHENTGVTARLDSAANTIVFSSTEVGGDAFLRIEDIDGNGKLLGTLDTTTNSVSSVNDKGKDISGTINGTVAQGVGRTLSINTPVFSGSISFDYATSAGTTSAVASNATSGITGRDAAQVAPVALPAESQGRFTVESEGLKFQLGAFADPNNQESIGIDNLSTYNLGVQNGRLSSLKAGGINDVSTNADQAVRIVDEAITDVASTRARLGAFQSNTLETSISSLSVAIENVTSSESRIRDLDFATETAAFTKAQILVQAGTSILSQANVSTASILSLLK